MTNASYHFSTLALHHGQALDASTFSQRPLGQHQGCAYSRAGNPNRSALESCLAALEGGQCAAAFASGPAATDAVLRALLRPGDEVVAAADLDGGTFRLLEKVYEPWGTHTHYLEETSAGSFATLMNRNTRIVWIESPTNVLRTVIDIRDIADVAHRAGALLVVDNTFATPYLQQPLRRGADLVVHSTTKYLGGHSDVVGGAVIGRRELLEPIHSHQDAAGAVPGSFEACLTLRGIKTLAVRMEHHSSNARQLANWLAGHSEVEQVYYPGLTTHPGHDIAQRQMRAFGGMIAVRLRGGKDAAMALLTNTKLFSLAENPGSIESLISHPATMTHADIPGEIRVRRGIDDAVVCLSVGIEHVADLQRDLDQALTVQTAGQHTDQRHASPALRLETGFVAGQSEICEN
jgi:cystathionine beta-lyase/cystathionine gamma-synthase